TGTGARGGGRPETAPQPLGRLQADDAAGCGWNSHWALAVRPNRSVDQRGGHRGGRTSARSAWDQLLVPRVVDGTEGAHGGGAAHGPLVHVVLTDDDCPGRAQSLHHPGVIVCDEIGHEGRGIGGGPAGDRDVVLY